MCMWIGDLKLSVKHLHIVPRVRIPVVSFLMHPDCLASPPLCGSCNTLLVDYKLYVRCSFEGRVF